MIKLFYSNETQFKNNGEVVLQPYKCIVSNQDNGDFTLDIEVPAKYSDYIQGGNIIVAPTPIGEQGFRIWNVEKKARRITAKAKHLFYDSEKYFILSGHVNRVTAWTALNAFNAVADVSTPFSFYSNVNDPHDLTEEKKTLKEVIDDIVTTWGGHVKRDNWNVSLLSDISHDEGVTIRYGKNLEEMTATYDWSNVVTKLLPIGKNNITLRRIYLYADRSYPIPYTKAVTFNQDHIKEEDYKDAEGNTDTARYEEALRADLVVQGEKYLRENCVPSVNYTLKGRPEKVTDIGDVIEVIDERIGVRLTTQVISYKFNCIRERYEELEFGNFKKSLKQLIKDIK